MDGFHDAVVRELVTTGEEYVDRDYTLRMTSDVGASARLLVQTQRRDIGGLELRFIGVEELAYNRLEQVEPARCSVVRDELLEFAFASVVIRARACEGVMLDAEGLGADARLTRVKGEPERS
jgi:hypothetical protein